MELTNQVVLSLLEYISPSRLFLLSQTSKNTSHIMDSKEVLGILKNKHNDTKSESFAQFYTSYNKVKDIIEAVKDDDPNFVLAILKHRRKKKGSDLVPTLLSLAAVLSSRQVFECLCKVMTSEINTLGEESYNSLPIYFDGLLDITLRTNDDAIYRLFFTSLSNCNGGLSEVFLEPMGCSICGGVMLYYSYSRVLMGGDNAAYKTIRSILDEEPTDNILLGYEYIRTIEFLHWLITTNKYTVAEMLNSSVDKHHTNYLNGKISYDQAKILERNNSLLRITMSLESATEL